MAESESSLGPAFEALCAGDLTLACEVCERVLAGEADNPKAWHLLGAVHAQKNDLVRATECFEKAIEIRPDVASYHYNLGLAYQKKNEPERAADAYRSAVSVKPDFLEAASNLGNCLVEMDQRHEAVEHFRELGERYPDEAIVHYNLANVLQDDGDYTDSITEFRRAIELDPDFATARENLGRALSDVTRYEEALQVWEDWLEYDPNSAVARHMIASVTGESMPDRCDDDYVRDTFDQAFARSYEKQLERIDYSVPKLVGAAIESLGIDRNDLDVLDAGCGTGLCAEKLRPLAGQLIGVDLSTDMLNEAKKRKVYDALEACELTEYLASNAGPFDLIVSGDTLCYFGQLGQVLENAARCLNPNGMLVFTVERLDPDGDATKPYELQPHGRYRHQEAYVREVLSQANLDPVDIGTGTLRLERGRDVVGLVVIAKRAHR